MVKPISSWTRAEAWRYIVLLAWVRFRMLFHRRCNLSCETKRRLYLKVFVPIGYITDIEEDETGLHVRGVLEWH